MTTTNPRAQTAFEAAKLALTLVLVLCVAAGFHGPVVIVWTIIPALGAAFISWHMSKPEERQS